MNRSPYQGVMNIIRFNWHFYLFSGISIAILLLSGYFVNNIMFWPCIIFASAILFSTLTSLVVSHYVYDRSGFYDFDWLHHLNKPGSKNIMNIHAGFDETSSILKRSFQDATLQVFDFYDPIRHTEVSIERARRAYPPYHGTTKITTSKVPVEERSVDLSFNIFALHEVRERNERINFLKEQVAVLKDDGRVILIEHLRDLPNFLAYNIGFVHFFSGAEWNHSFKHAGLRVADQFKITPFITGFILSKIDGNTP